MSCLTSSDEILKQPVEVRNVSMDFTNILEDGETISSESVVITPSDVTASSVSSNEGIVYFTISGGTAGTNYNVMVTINTSNSQVIVGEGILKVRGG